jgi:cytochrome c biogenesis protein CcmG/thiol:disulfide interchange protein DsbE
LEIVLSSRGRKLGYSLAIICGGCLGAVQGGESTELDALRGKVVYLDFWASWCVPCRQSFPWMQTIETTYESKGFTVIAVNLDHDRADADAFLKQFQPDFQVRFDPEGRLAQQFNVRGMPTSVLIDRHGAVRFTHIGFRPQDGAKHTRQIEQLLAEK